MEVFHRQKQAKIFAVNSKFPIFVANKQFAL